MTPIELSPNERTLIFQATGRRVAAIVTGTPSEKLRTELGPELSERSILGAFVSLKRGGQLRSCMGCLAESFALADAVENAATRASKDDPRFPPISPDELLELDMEVWVLWGMKKCLVPASERLHEIEIGRHGVVLEKGMYRGLLLPGVAVEHAMDELTFLEACCRKAGLPPNAWVDESVTFSTFEGLAISGRMDEVEILSPETLTAIGRKGPLQMMIRKKEGPSQEDVLKLRNLCRDNFFLCSDGMTPTYFRPDIYEGNVYGIAISVQLPERPLMVCSKVGTKAEMPLQASLVDMVQVLTQQITKIGATHQERLNARFDLTVLWDPMVHGSPLESDLSQVDSFRRALMVANPDGWVLQFNPDVPITGVLEDGIDYLRTNNRNEVTVLTFEAMSTTQHLLASSISKPVLGEAKRPPAVAGAFYPSDATLMNAELQRMFGANRPQKERLHGPNVPPGQDPSGGIRFGNKKATFRPELPVPELYSAVMVPHAGWIYSGRLAAQTLAKALFPSTAIIFAPKHKAGGQEWAIAPNRTWLLPGMEVASDFALAQEIAESVDLMQLDATAHAQEHAIEVLLPLVHYLSPNTKVVGISMHSCPWDLLREEAAQFADLMRRVPQLPLFIISTDMNHFASDEATREVDKIALEAIQTLDPQRLLETVLDNRISMCGVTPTAFVMEVLRQLNLLNECVPVGYTTSAETSGDTSRVVGYAGMLFR